MVRPYQIRKQSSAQTTMIQKKNIHALFNPASVAVLGATPDISKPGGRSLAFLKKFGYRGKIFPVNAKYHEIDGLTCYPDLQSLPEPAELVILLVPAHAVPEYLKLAGQAGVKAAVICTSGFAEAGNAGIALQRALEAAARENDIAVLGPNCLGLMDLHSGLTATFTTALEGSFTATAGPVAFVSQSGAMGAAVFSIAQRDGVALGKFISTGNEAVLDFTDFLEYLSDDPQISLILGYIEGVRDGRRFVAAARRARRAGKTVAVLKVGKSDAGMQAAKSHTGALAGSAQVYEAAFRRAGVLSVDHVRTLLDMAVALPGQKPAGGRRVGIISMSGGAGVMMADACAAGGLEVAPLAAATQDALAKVLPDFVGRSNPVDYGPIYGDPDAIEACIDITAADPGIDILLVFMGLSPGMVGIIEPRLARVQERCGKPLITAWMGGPVHGITSLRKAGIATFDDPSRAVEMAIQLVRVALPLPGDDLPAEAVPLSPRAMATQRTLREAIAAGQSALSEREVKALMAGYGIPVVPEVLARTAQEAETAGRRFNRPLAVKAESPDLLHKSDAGAVCLRVAPEDAANAFNQVVAAAAIAVGADKVRGALIQPMAQAGLEVLAGLRHDAQFGPTITVGLGGVTSEVLADVITEIVPIDLDLARSMLRRLRSAPLFGPFRGGMARDIDSLAETLVALSQFALDAGPLLAELDLNPVIVHEAGSGCTVVDGAAVLGMDEVPPVSS